MKRGSGCIFVLENALMASRARGSFTKKEDQETLSLTFEMTYPEMKTLSFLVQSILIRFILH